jgi:hypothetical protein
MAAKFSKRHYEVLARMLAEIRANHPVEDAGEDVGYGKALIDLEHDMIAIFQADNARFDAQRFHDAAQPRAAQACAMDSVAA